MNFKECNYDLLTMIKARNQRCQLPSLLRKAIKGLTDWPLNSLDQLERKRQKYLTHVSVIDRIIKLLSLDTWDS